MLDFFLYIFLIFTLEIFKKIFKTFAPYLARSIFDSLPGEKVENRGNLNRTMHKLQKAKMKSGNAEIFGRNLHKFW